MNSMCAKQLRYLVIINMLATLLWGASSTIYCASEQELEQEGGDRQELSELGAIEPNLERQAAQNSVPKPEALANPEQLRAALEAAIKNKNREEGNEQLEALLEHEIIPHRTRELLLDELLRLAFLTQEKSEDTYAMELLLEAKADPNALIAPTQEDEASCSALHWATICKNPQAVQLFLDYGADPLITDDTGKSCLETDSSKEAHKLLINNIIQRLQAGKLDSNYCAPHTRQPLLSTVLNVPISCLPQIVPLVKELLDRKANPNEPNTRGDLPLHTVRGLRLIATNLAKEYASEEKGQEEFYAALRDLDTMLYERGALEYAPPAQQWLCVIQ